ncbi:sugar kinase [Izhakiella australiensis]|uniref:Sugar kinase n=1 Tax=Izhakiella australiensis TaxID=1926881 RepID=A0A1S8YPW8_9GAMM|nr:FGGY-family carbohydrate kinase [Izhakiella australiensis]OON40915.1 sugar kinase [Izhakiella australiensis]
MSQHYLIGIDIGTQSAKVVIFTTGGQIVCEQQQPLRPLATPAPQYAEHPDDDLWSALQIACRKAMACFHQLGGQNHQLLAAGLCVIRCCRVLMKSDGELAWPVINWMDKRLNQPYQHQPEYGDVSYVTTSSGYITHRLTGQLKDTCANYIGWWPMDNDRQQWSEDPALWQRCNLRPDQVLDVIPPGSIAGEVTAAAAQACGLPVGLPVVVTAHDKAVEALGAGSLTPGVALISLGTYIGAMTHGEKNHTDARHFWPFQASLPGSWLYECMDVRRGMWTVSWFRDQFGAAALAEATDRGVSIEQLMNQQAAQVPPGSEGLITLHDWAPPAEAEFRKGAILGFDGRHTRAHMFRSLLEGIALTMKNHMDKMADELGVPFHQLIISGGGANSDLFMQIFADIFGLPAQRNKMKSSAAIGCAINAGMAMKIWPDYASACAQLVQPGECFHPDARHHQLYQQLNEAVYQRLHSQLDPLFSQLSPLVDS